MIKSTFEWENKLRSDGYGLIIGIDEVGRGPLAGPVVAAAVALKSSEGSTFGASSGLWDLVRDSKTLSEKQRERMFDFIQSHFYVGLGICDHKTIDRVNILEASFLAMKAAITDLKSKSKNSVAAEPLRRSGSAATRKENNGQFVFSGKCIILVDGNKIIPNFSFEQKAIVGGDKLVKSISAASIAAKVTRDRLMKKMHEKYPCYGFDRHMGYGTKAHLAALKKYGPCEIHRRSFAPVKKLSAKP